MGGSEGRMGARRTNDDQNRTISGLRLLAAVMCVCVCVREEARLKRKSENVEQEGTQEKKERRENKGEGKEQGAWRSTAVNEK